MSKSVSHRPGPRRRDRTFTGCLTCRRRKIKCDDPPFPCRKCQALNLDCVPPFSRNLRVVTPAFSPSGPHLLKISPISYEENEYQSLPHPPPAADAANPWDATQVTDGPQWCPIDLCPPYDPMIWAPCYGQALQVPHKDNAWDTGSAFSCFTAQDSCWTWGFPVQLADETPTHNTINLLGDGALLPSANKKEPLAFTSDGCIEGCGRSTVYITSDLTTGPSSDQRNDEYRSATESSAVDFIQSLPSVPSPLQNEIIPQTPESDTTTEFFRHYQQVMSRIFSVKDSRWNIYAYMLRISQRSSYPVRSGLLAWSGLHLSTQNVLQEPCATYHYHAAGCGAQELIRKASQLDNTAYPQSRDGSGMALTRTRTLLIVLFFLCQCDVITCNWSAYRSRMHTFKNALNKRWDTFRHSLQSTDYRILLWLSYLDVRASVWSPSGANCTELYSPTLLDIISKWEDVRSVYRKSRTYLHDAFQWEYPGPQLRDDMLQDPVNANLAETMSLISRIIALDKSLIGSQDDSSELQRQAIELDIEAIRSKLKDMDQECELALQGFQTGRKIDVNRSSYHWLNLKATQRSALILLNRKVSPEIRNDDDSQKAAADILQIIILLKKANMMHNPHLIYSPFFIFVAGIEVCDPVYQECTLAILRDLKGWGGNVCKVIQLLQYVTARQEQLDRRIEIGAMMEECGLSMVI